jgi:hypothetical protein
MTQRSGLTRRELLRAAAAGTMALAASTAWAEAKASPSHKTALSFYCDDTSPFGHPPDTFKRFLDFVEAEGVAGESTVLLGAGWEGGGLLSQPLSDLQQAYLTQVRRAHDCGIDTHMEVMTHGGVFDFAKGLVPEGAIHEGVWMHTPGIPVATYQDYFAHVLAAGEKLEIRFTGVTWPGCGCEDCTRRWDELRKAGTAEVNPNVWQALLNLAKAGKFRNHTVPCFVSGEVPDARAQLMAGEGKYGVYDLSPNVGDQFGSYTNSTDRVSADYHITEDGEQGRIVEAVRKGAPYCLFYTHWQGLNPDNGVGWGAFQTVVKRVNKHLSGKVEWMRPSDYTDRVIAAEAGKGKAGA